MALSKMTHIITALGIMAHCRMILFITAISVKTLCITISCIMTISIKMTINIMRFNSTYKLHNDTQHNVMTLSKITIKHNDI